MIEPDCSVRNRVLTACCAALLTLTLAGCAAKHPATPLAEPTPEAAWDSFQAEYCAAPQGRGITAKASMVYTRTKPMKRTNLLQLTIWGDFDRPLRLDAAAGIGTPLAHVLEDDAGLLVFYPQDNVAYMHPDPVLGATRLGLPFPFSLKQLVRILAGDFSGLAGKTYVSATRRGDRFIYVLDHPLVREATLSLDGRPESLYGTASGPESGNWTMEINSFGEPENGAPNRPGRLTLRLDSGKKGVLRIKAVALKLAAWPDSAMRLELPEHVAMYRLDRPFDAEAPLETTEPIEDTP